MYYEPRDIYLFLPVLFFQYFFFLNRFLLILWLVIVLLSPNVNETPIVLVLLEMEHVYAVCTNIIYWNKTCTSDIIEIK